MILIARLFQNGLGVEKDQGKARQWYELAARQNEPEALFQLGLISLEEQDEEAEQRALAFFQKSAEQGHKDGAYNAALLHLKPDSRLYNKDEALKLLEEGASRDHGASQHALAIVYQEGTLLPPSPVKAAEWMGKAALNGLSEAQIEYALMLLKGTGLPKDESAAFLWLQKASDSNHPVAHSLLAQMYMKGLGTAVDEAKAKELYQKAKAMDVNNPWLENRVR
jgi:TPR repeat protein